MQKIQRQQQQQPQSSQGTRYPKRQAVKGVQQKEITQNPSTSTITLVTSTYLWPLVTSSVSMSTLASSVSTPITTASADVAAHTAKYTSNSPTFSTSEINDRSSWTTLIPVLKPWVPHLLSSRSTELQNLQWLYQQFSDMKLGADHAEMCQSLKQEQDQLIAEVKKQLELEKWQAVDETKK
ncbi:hypothetical protein MJT46_019154 [Ovis ammon polii x Ovis aries]|nr:hypothetical protein MJT46_019154 [Ovis ammon polii x Ovis aries]